MAIIYNKIISSFISIHPLFLVLFVLLSWNSQVKLMFSQPHKVWSLPLIASQAGENLKLRKLPNQFGIFPLHLDCTWVEEAVSWVTGTFFGWTSHSKQHSNYLSKVIGSYGWFPQIWPLKLLGILRLSRALIKSYWNLDSWRQFFFLSAISPLVFRKIWSYSKRNMLKMQFQSSFLLMFDLYFIAGFYRH